MGVVFYLLHTYWFLSFNPLALPAVLLVAVLYFGAWGYLLRWTGLNAWYAAAGWMMVQWVIASGFLAFPWSRLATALAAQPVLIQPVRLYGELLYGGLIVLFGFGLVEAVNRRGWSALLVSFVLLASGIGWGSYRYYETDVTATDRAVTLVQPNVISTLGGAPSRGPSQQVVIERLTRSIDKRDRLIIWPESVIKPYVFELTGSGSSLRYRAEKHRWKYDLLLAEGTRLLSGLRVFDPKKNKLDYLNGAVLLDAAGNSQSFYTKRIMVPVGEYIPGMGEYEIIEHFGRAIGTLGYRSGDVGGLISLDRHGRTLKAAVQICFEDAFPNYVYGQVRRGGDLLVNLSNDSWSRSTAAHWQHFYRAKLQAVATGRTMLRNGNTGVSAVVDPLGRVRSILPPFERGVLRGTIFEPLPISFIVKYNSLITYSGLFGLLALGWLTGRQEQ
jgi:apolipoprotein N-acyltransferase